MPVRCPRVTRLLLRGCKWVDGVSLEYLANHSSKELELQTKLREEYTEKTLTSVINVI